VEDVRSDRFFTGKGSSSRLVARLSLWTSSERADR
jgi:hypothetical protein